MSIRVWPSPVSSSLLCLAGALAACLVLPAAAHAEEPKPQLGRAELVAAAREIMAGQTYCALITLDEAGRPQVRTMNPFPPDEDMVVWIATSTRTRKVQQLRKDPRVVLYYANHAQATGYVAISGRAELVEDANEIQKRKRAYWDDGKGGGAFPGLKNLVLIKVVPERLDVLNYAKGAVADPVTWRTPSVELGVSPSEPKGVSEPKP